MKRWIIPLIDTILVHLLLAALYAHTVWAVGLGEQFLCVGSFILAYIIAIYAAYVNPDKRGPSFLLSFTAGMSDVGEFARHSVLYGIGIIAAYILDVRLQDHGFYFGLYLQIPLLTACWVVLVTRAPATLGALLYAYTHRSLKEGKNEHRDHP
jgi:hypothetical protein